MSIQIVTDNGVHLLPKFAQEDVRKGIIDAMANDLVAGAERGLDLTCDDDVKAYLDHDRRYSERARRLYTAAATLEAKEIIATACMGDVA